MKVSKVFTRMAVLTGLLLTIVALAQVPKAPSTSLPTQAITPAQTPVAPYPPGLPTDPLATFKVLFTCTGCSSSGMAQITDLSPITVHLGRQEWAINGNTIVRTGTILSSLGDLRIGQPVIVQGISGADANIPIAVVIEAFDYMVRWSPTGFGQLSVPLPSGAVVTANVGPLHTIWMDTSGNRTVVPRSPAVGTPIWVALRTRSNGYPYVIAMASP